MATIAQRDDKDGGAVPMPPEKLDEIRRKADLVALARATTSLRKQGHSLVGCCPFHRERTPSFSVHPDKQLFYCFGCQRGGDVFAFVMQTAGLDFAAAARQLAEQTGVALAPLSPAAKSQRDALRAICGSNEAAQKITHAALFSPRGPAGRDRAREVLAYLTQRGIDGRTARTFGLGYGGASKALASALAAAGVNEAAQRQAGFLGEDAKESFLVGRLVFPIYDVGSNLVGFGARRLDHAGRADKTQAKYLNSRESAAFRKHEQLFGLAQAAATMRQRKEALLVEGYLDVLALHQAGASHAVAALGTQLTEAHVAALKRFADSATLLLDGDKAGLRASFRASQVLLRQGMQVQLVTLPPGEDPASLAQSRGPRALLQALASGEPAVASFVRRAFCRDGTQTIERRVRAAQALMPLIDSLQSGLEKTLYISRVAEHVGVSVDVLQQHWQRARPKRSGAPPPGASPQKAGPRRAATRAGAAPAQAAPPAGRGASASAETKTETEAARPPPAATPAELALVRELLLFPSLFARLGEVAALLHAPQLRLLLQSLASQENPEAALPDLLTQCIVLPRERASLAQVRPFVGKSLDEGQVRANRTLADILRGLKRRAVDDALRRVLGELADAERRGDATDALIRRKQHLTAEKRALCGPAS